MPPELCPSLPPTAVFLLRTWRERQAEAKKASYLETGPLSVAEPNQLLWSPSSDSTNHLLQQHTRLTATQKLYLFLWSLNNHTATTLQNVCLPSHHSLAWAPSDCSPGPIYLSSPCWYAPQCRVYRTSELERPRNT